MQAGLGRRLLAGSSFGGWHGRSSRPAVRLTFCGVRGSTPAPGAEFLPSDHAPLNLGRGRDGQGELHEAALSCALAEAAEVRTLVLFHHDPCRTDDEITAIVDRIPTERVEVVAAEEGMVLEL
jgi:hypothetical protein